MDLYGAKWLLFMRGTGSGWVDDLEINGCVGGRVTCNYLEKLSLTKEDETIGVCML